MSIMLSGALIAASELTEHADVHPIAIIAVGVCALLCFGVALFETFRRNG